MPERRQSSANPRWSAVLRALREAAGIAQAGWATRLGCGLRTLQRWEHAELVPNARAADAVVELCGALGLFRQHHHGVLAGVDATPDWLRTLLVDARNDAAVVKEQRVRQALTAFIGRAPELAALGDLVREARLVTLTGMGGVGKTRLALEVARTHAAECADVCWVELAPLSDGSRVTETVAAALQVREQPGRLLLETLTETLRDRKILIVLDNCEHVLDACADLTATVLGRCPDVRVLATSRVVMGVSGETVWPVGCLSLPQAGTQTEDVLRSEAVQLFLERARSALPRWYPSPQDIHHIAALCWTLDGLPLAIELAAAWVRILTPEELTRRLAHSFALLKATGRDLPARQRTLKATLDWSYQLLAEPERRLLARLSVFAGGATLDAIETVGHNDRGDAPTVVESLARLLDASLIQRVDAPKSAPRFRLLATVRDYAHELLAAFGELDTVRWRHATFFRDLAESARPHLTGPDQARWLDALAWVRRARSARLGSRSVRP
jgi:predicted ATPase